MICACNIEGGLGTAEVPCQALTDFQPFIAELLHILKPGCNPVCYLNKAVCYLYQSFICEILSMHHNIGKSDQDQHTVSCYCPCQAHVLSAGCRGGKQPRTQTLSALCQSAEAQQWQQHWAAVSTPPGGPFPGRAEQCTGTAAALLAADLHLGGMGLVGSAGGCDGRH